VSLEPLPEDWGSALAIVAHPDDMEYGAASAVARWTDQGKHVAYLLVTRGEAGIDSMAPEEVIPVRADEQRRSCAAVGVDTLEFLDHRDGLVTEGLDLRRDLVAAVRRHRPDVLGSTTPTTGRSGARCSPRRATPATAGCSSTPACPIRCGSSPSTPPRRRPTSST
jgi:LmbE family N-acetylglucosaminyl deacetylase